MTHLDHALAEVVRDEQRAAQRAVLNDLDTRRIDLFLRLEVERVDVPRVPVERRVLEDDKAGRAALEDELALELLVVDARDAAGRRNSDFELRRRKDEVVAGRAGCMTRRLAIARRIA